MLSLYFLSWSLLCLPEQDSPTVENKRSTGADNSGITRVSNAYEASREYKGSLFFFTQYSIALSKLIFSPKHDCRTTSNCPVIEAWRPVLLSLPTHLSWLSIISSTRDHLLGGYCDNCNGSDSARLALDALSKSSLQILIITFFIDQLSCLGIQQGCCCIHKIIIIMAWIDHKLKSILQFFK